MTHLTIPGRRSPSDRNALASQLKSAVVSFRRGFVKGVVEMGSFGMATPAPKKRIRRSDFEALAGDWKVVSDGLNVTISRAKIRGRR